jgi:hypothetical protein
MEEDRFEMGQQERDRLKVLQEARNGQINAEAGGRASCARLGRDDWWEVVFRY